MNFAADGYQRLALAVIERALEDSISGPPSEWAEPRAFFDGGPMFRFWCLLADVNPDKLQRRFQQAIAQGNAVPMRRRRRTCRVTI